MGVGDRIMRKNIRPKSRRVLQCTTQYYYCIRITPHYRVLLRNFPNLQPLQKQWLQDKALYYNSLISGLLCTGGFQPSPRRRILYYFLLVRSSHRDSLLFLLVKSIQRDSLLCSSSLVHTKILCTLVFESYPHEEILYYFL